MGKKTVLALAISMATLCTSAKSEAVELEGSSLRQHIFLGAHDKKGDATLSSLPSLINDIYANRATTRPLGRTAVDIRHTGSDDRLFTWVFTEALEDEVVARDIHDKYVDGVPILVITPQAGDEEFKAIASVFGAAARTEMAIYVQTSDGPRIFSMASPSIHDDIAATTTKIVQDIGLLLATPIKAAAGDEENVDLYALPRMTVINTAYASSNNGSSVTLEATVTRNSTRSKDAFLVISKSSFNIKPHDSGLSSGKLTIAKEYELEHTIILDSEKYEPRIVEQFPGTNGSTDITISTLRSVKTSYGFNLSAETSRGLKDNVPEASAKVGFGFSFGREYTDQKSIEMTLKDYSIVSSAVPNLPRTRTVKWSLGLAPAILADAEYFGKSPGIGRVTPNMQAVAPETHTVWELDGKYTGPINLKSHSTVTNAKYDGGKVEATPDPRLQAVATLTIDANSPYLTRETAVFIHAEKGSGGCLWDANGSVELRPCPDTSRLGWENERHAQWQLDAEKRYYNRGSKQCMELLENGLTLGGSQIKTAPCNLTNEQRWEWRADRIYSRFNGGENQWRLYLDANNVLNARITDRNLYQDIPVNPYNNLLRPWSTYPVKPVTGVFVPVLVGRTPDIPEDWLRFNAVGADQRWSIITLRASLGNQ